MSDGLNLDLRAARMLEAGRLTATVTSQASGEHITLKFRCQKKDPRWMDCPLEEATHCFVEVPRADGTWPNDKVMTWYPPTGNIYVDQKADPARVTAAEQVLAFVFGAHVEDARIQEANQCGRCGRELTDPVSIERGIGPECFGKATGSQHQVKQSPFRINKAS